MTDAERLAELRELFLIAPEAASTRAVALLGSLLLMGTVLWLVRRRTLREEYTPIWLGVATAIAAISIWPPLLSAITRAVGAWTPSSTVFFFGVAFLMAICLNFAVRLSSLTLRQKNLAQELALLRDQVEAAAGRAGPPEPAR